MLEPEATAGGPATTPADGAATLAGDGLRAGTAILTLIAAAAVSVAITSLLLLLFGPSEKLETWQWNLAFLLALPAGLVVGHRQARELADADVAWAAAAGIGLVGGALLFRSTGTGDGPRHLVVLVAAAGALTAPWLVRRVRPSTATATAGYATALGIVAVALIMFLPDASLQSRHLVPALVLGGIVLVALLATATRRLPARPRHGLDLVLMGILGLVVLTLPDIRTAGYELVHHQNFYLGPINAIRHGRPMLDGTWSQYGVANMDALRFAFGVIPFGYGGLALIVTVVTAAQYVLVYVILRLAIRSQLLVAATIASEVILHILGLSSTYIAVPSTSPLRFGLPYLVIAAAVFGARHPPRARLAQVTQLVVVALAAIWSFEAFVYTGAAFGLIALTSELAAGPGWPRRVARRAIAGLGAAVLAVLAYTALVLVFAGDVDWGPYFDYLRLYSVEGFGQLPITFFSTGPLMGAFIFLSVVGTVHLAHVRSSAATPTQLTALAGFGGASAAFFTYYLGRSHPTNLLHILLPVVALGGLWAALLLQARPSPARLGGLAVLALTAAMLVVAGWPTAKIRWLDSAFAQTVPFADGKPAGKGRSVTTSLRRMWRQPVFDPRAPSGEKLLARYLPPGAPALVLTEPELTTELLDRADRRNVLPIANPIEDNLIASSTVRVVRAAERVPAGTLMLTTPPPVTPGQTGGLGGNPLDFVPVQSAALGVLQRRFRFRHVATTPDGLQLVRLEIRRRAAPKPAPRPRPVRPRKPGVRGPRARRTPSGG